MHISTFASGSAGNCAILSYAGTHILIDAGISMRKIRAGLSTLSIAPDDISGILITHEHSDHISGLAMMTKYYKMPVYASAAVARGLTVRVPGIEGRLREIKPGNSYRLGLLDFSAFRTPHDTPESVGYRVSAEGMVFGCCTDLGHVTDEVIDGLSGVDVAMIEANHDVQMLKNGPYPYFLKRRILSDSGHLSNESCGDLAALLASRGTGCIVLGHLSQENNNPHLARLAVETALEKGGFTPGEDIRVQVAPAAGLHSVDYERTASA